MDEPLFGKLKQGHALARWLLMEALVDEGLAALQRRLPEAKAQLEPEADFREKLCLWEALALQWNNDLFLTCEVNRIRSQADAFYERYKELIFSLGGRGGSDAPGAHRQHVTVSENGTRLSLQTEAHLDHFNDELERLLGRLQQLYQRFDWFPQGRERALDCQKSSSRRVQPGLRVARRR